MGPMTELLPELQKIVDVYNSTKQLTVYALPTNEEGKNHWAVLITENVWRKTVKNVKKCS